MSLYRFPQRARLIHRKQYEAVFEARVRAGSGPLLVYGLINDLGYNRLGLSVSRRVGNAVRRNRIKRMIREAFRLSQHEVSHSYDLVVVARPHEDLPLTDYIMYLQQAIESLERKWRNQVQQPRK